MRIHLASCLALAGCGAPVASLTLEPTQLVITQRLATATIKPTPRDAAGNLVPRALLEVAWSSSDPAVALVVNGTITALKSGRAQITASVEESKATAEVRVSIPEVLTLSANEAEIVGLGKTAELIATLRDDAGNAITDATVVWETSSATVAKVSNGRIEGVGLGTATLTATHGKLKATAKVRVRYPTIARIDVTPRTGVLWFARGGEGVRLNTTLRDEQDRAIEGVPYAWSSSDPTIVSVTPDGIVTALRRGKATLVLTAPDHTVEVVARVLN